MTDGDFDMPNANTSNYHVAYRSQEDGDTDNYWTKRKPTSLQSYGLHTNDYKDIISQTYTSTWAANPKHGISKGKIRLPNSHLFHNYSVDNSVMQKPHRLETTNNRWQQWLLM